MSDEEFPEMQNIRDLFEKILGSEVNIKDEINNSEEKIFITLIKKLEQSFKKENQIEKISGIDLTKVTEDLWFVVENLIGFSYGEEAREIIMWYILFRVDENGKEHLYEDDNGNFSNINTPKRLWKFLKKRNNEK